MRISKPVSNAPGPLNRQVAVPDEALREKVKASMADGRPGVPAGVVFKRLRAHHSRRMTATTAGT
jgi:hypothetical protein